MNGRFEAHHSCTSGLPAGVRFMPLRKAEDAAAKLGTVAAAFEGDAFAELRVLASAPPVWLDTLDFGVIRLDAGRIVEAPWTTEFRRILHSQAIVRSGRGSSSRSSAEGGW